MKALMATVCIGMLIAMPPDAWVQTSKKGRRSQTKAAGGRGSAAPAVLAGHTEEVKALVFSPDGWLVAAAGNHDSNYVVVGNHAVEGALKLWDRYPLPRARVVHGLVASTAK